MLPAIVNRLFMRLGLPTPSRELAGIGCAPYILIWNPYFGAQVATARITFTVDNIGNNFTASRPGPHSYHCQHPA
jgi:hypothetical protein